MRSKVASGESAPQPRSNATRVLIKYQLLGGIHARYAVCYIENEARVCFEAQVLFMIVVEFVLHAT